MGRTVRFDQIYVSSLDADPLEQDVLTSVRSIITSEIEADELVVQRLGIANTNPTTNVSVGTDLFITNGQEIILDVKKSIRTARLFVDDKIGIGTTNPTRTLEIRTSGEDRFIVDTNPDAESLLSANGNTFSRNLHTSNVFRVGTGLTANATASNILSVTGNTYSTNVYVGKHLVVGSEAVSGSNVAVFRNGNVVVDGGFLQIYGGMNIYGNLSVTQGITYTAVNNLVVSNAVIQMGTGNNGLYDTGVLMVDDPSRSNIIAGYIHADNEFVLGRTLGGPVTQTFTVDTSNTMNLHVYGELYTEGHVGIANTSPNHTLALGSNVYFDDTGSNVMYTTGNVFVNKLAVGSGGITVGNLLSLEPLSTSPVVISSNVQMNGLRTTGTASSGIANTSPTDTLSIGSKIFANVSTANTLTVVGNTATTSLVTDLVFSSSNITIHGDRFGGDSTSNVLTLKSGPTASNVSSIEVYGASTSNTHQNIRFNTKNAERMRIASGGNVGISNTNPTEKLTVAGNIYVIGSNASVYGNIWGSTGNTSMRVLSSAVGGENKIENIVAAGKGLNFYASRTATMGTPKMTILESSNVGIGTATPVGRLHTSGGTVFINTPVTYSNGYNHLGSPLVVTNTNPLVSTTDSLTVLHLTGDGNEFRDGVRATFKMSKHDIASGKSKSKLDIYLADESYTDERYVMSLKSDGRVGIGTTQPAAHLEVYSTGIANPQENGLLIHNHVGGDAIVSMQTDVNSGNAFTSYIQADGDIPVAGWSTGVTGTGDYRITQSPYRVYDSGSIGLFIDNVTRNVGIGTDVPRAKLEVLGNVVIGNKLSFFGLSGDDFGNTHIQERRYSSEYTKNELLLFKGNDASSVDQGPDRIRHIAAEHVFQTYTSSGEDFETILIAKDAEIDKPLLITDTGIVVVGGQRSDANGKGANTKLVVNGDIEFGAGGAFKLSGFALSTTEGLDSINKIRNLLNGTSRRPLTFVHEVDGDDDFEFARFDSTGNLGIGTSTVGSNVHIYSASTDTVNLLKLESPGTNKETGMLIYTNDGEGGYIRGFSNSTNSTTGLVMGVSNNSTMTNCIHMIHTSNVGIGTATPATQFHLYNGTPRIEHSTSNALIELKTTGGTSNIMSSTTGNVYIQPHSSTTFVRGDLEITGDLTVDGAIDLGDQVAIGLGDETANTSLHVNGGIITNSDQVACKKYSNAVTITGFNDKTITFTFRQPSFYAKIVGILRRTDGATVVDSSTMILDVQGGTDDGSLSTVPIAVGTKSIFGGSNFYPWSPTVTTTDTTVTISPYDTGGTRTYKYDLVVDVMTSNGGGLESIKSGTIIRSTFTY
jgi:hypothetical protein